VPYYFADVINVDHEPCTPCPTCMYIYICTIDLYKSALYIYIIHTYNTYIYVYLYTYSYTHMYIRRCIYINVYIHRYVNIYVCIYMYIYHTHICIFVSVFMNKHLCSKNYLRSGLVAATQGLSDRSQAPFKVFDPLPLKASVGCHKPRKVRTCCCHSRPLNYVRSLTSCHS